MTPYYAQHADLFRAVADILVRDYMAQSETAETVAEWCEGFYDAVMTPLTVMEPSELADLIAHVEGYERRAQMTNEKGREEMRRGNLYDWLSPKLSIEERDTLDNLLHCVEKNAKADPEKAERERITARCPICHGKGVVYHPCTLCCDSTYDHLCNDYEEPCPNCSAILYTDKVTPRIRQAVDRKMIEIVMRIVSEYVDASDCNYALYPNNMSPVAKQFRAALGDKSISELIAILTSEPEPCEDSTAWSLLGEIMSYDYWKQYPSNLRERAENAISRAEQKASQVADKRAEELRAKIDTLMEALKKIDFEVDNIDHYEWERLDAIREIAREYIAPLL